MPNGAKNDHPLTDITVHGANLYGEGLDDLIRETDRLMTDVPSVQNMFLHDQLARLIGDNNPQHGKAGDRQAFRQALEKLKADTQSNNSKSHFPRSPHH
jgi:hypothetical protein